MTHENTPENKGRILRLEKISHNRLQGLDRDRTMVVAAVSPMEVHGPHLPLGQDLLEALALTEHALERIAEKHRDWSFVLLPPIPIATDCVPELGSINFPVKLVLDTAYHLLRPFAANGFARLLFTSFHGGPRHTLALEAAAHELSRRYDTAAISVLSAFIANDFKGHIFFDGIEHTPGRRIDPDQVRQDLHAGYVETSIGLHLWPELVDEGWESLEEIVSSVSSIGKEKNRHFLYGHSAPSGLSERFQQVLARIQGMAGSVRHFREHTYRGYPALASAEEGRDLFEHLVGLAQDVVEEFIEKGKDMDGRSPLWSFRHFLLNRGVNKVFDDWLGLYTES